MKKIITLILIGAALQSCKKELLDINKNPNSPAGVDATLVLPAALNNTANRVNNPSASSRFAHSCYWMGYWSYSGNFAIPTNLLDYKFNNTFEGGIWANTYKNIADYNYIDEKGKDNGNPFLSGIAKIMKAVEYQNLVDVFNNVPYSEGARGAEGVDFLKPKYDDAKTIYEDLVKQLDEAVALIKPASVAPSSSSDIMFGGNKTMWIRLANTIKLRLLLRQSEMAGRTSYIQAEIAKIIAEGTGFLNAGQSALINPGYLNSAGKMNPWYAANYDINGQYSNGFFVANQYAVDFYEDNNDPRLRFFFMPVGGYKKGPDGKDSIYRFDGVAYKFTGNFFGDQGIPNSDISFMGRGTLKSETQSSVLISSWESLFLQAEAALKGWITGNPKQLYEAAVSESFKYLGVASASTAAATYVSQTGNKEVNYDACTTDAEKLALIIRQKWASLNSINVMEAWNDYRRLKLPADIPLSKSPFAAASIPVRLLYPQTEYDTNAENEAAQGNISQFTSKIFWMK